MKHITLETIEPKRKLAQEIVCYSAFYVCCGIAAVLLIWAAVMPTMVEPTAKVCWTSMLMEALAIVVSYVAYWVKKNTL